MKKYFLLLIAGTLGLAVLAYLYRHGESPMVRGHEGTLRLFITAKQVEASLEKDVLKSRNFLLLNYDSIVEGEAEAERICAGLKGEEAAFYGKIVPTLDRAVDAYCSALATKLQKVEIFKSRNAVLRNSLYFVQKIASDVSAAKGAVSPHENRLIRAALAYALLPTDGAKAGLEALLREFDPRASEASDVLAAHAAKVLTGREATDELTSEIVNAPTAAFLEKLRSAYFGAFAAEEATAGGYRKILFGFCVAFLLVVAYNVVQLWRSAQDLVDANENLERRVEERTRELRESQETVTQQQQALAFSSKLSALGEMAGGIAHEINTPLAAIKNIASQVGEMVEDDPVDRAMIASMSAKVVATADRIARIVQGLRSFSRDGSQDDSAVVQLETLLDETLSFCRERLQTGSVDLRIKTEPGLRFEGRGTEVSQVLLNLLNNAHDAVSGLPEKWVELTAASRGGWLEIRVSDSGSGLPEAVRKKIFQPFFTTKEVGKGTGLGLSISLGIARRHGGELKLDTESKHTCFVLRLPETGAAKRSAA